MSTKLGEIAAKAKADPNLRFTALAHILTPEFLMETWRQMNRRGASGVDGESTAEFERVLEQRCVDIVARLKARTYKAPPVRRVEIPKGNGKTRPLGIPTVEDRLVQRAVARILESIYEANFLECSYGFRPRRSAHDALRALRLQLITGKVRYVFEADIRGYFNNIDHRWLRRMLELRIGDPGILRLIGKWLRAGVMVDGAIEDATGVGTPQGGPISPILANVYLHYVLDLWFERVFKRTCAGEAYLTRFADDYVVCFQYRADAEQFAEQLRERMEKFSLELADEKTRLIAFGRFARMDAAERGQKPETFDFLGFTHVCGVDKNGKFSPIRIPSRKSCRKFLDRVHTWLAEHRHWRRRDQQKHLAQMLRGFYQYFGLYFCRPKLNWVRNEVIRQWIRSLRRQSQRHRLYWAYLKSRSWFELPYPSLTHPTV
jgi:group II intron reverse transcriptase/maturase